MNLCCTHITPPAMSSSPNIVKHKSVTFINRNTPATVTTEDLDLDTCFSPDEVVIKVEAAALNPVDVLTHGLCPAKIVPQKPKTYSRDFAGIIVRRGDRVSDKWAVGTKVNGMFNHIWGSRGTFSNYLIVNPSVNQSIAIIPDNLPDILLAKYNEFEIGASWPLVFGTAYNCLFHHHQKFDENSRILVVGASTAVSSCLVQISKNYLRVGTVVGICNSNSIEYNKSLGFDYLIPYNEGCPADSVKGFIRDKLYGDKFDLIFDSVGSSYLKDVIDDVLKPRSENSLYITIASDSKIDYTSPTISGTFPWKSMIKSFNPMRRYNFAYGTIDTNPEYMEFGWKMLLDGQFVPRIDSVYKFDEYKEAIQRLKSNTAKGKIVIDIGE